MPRPGKPSPVITPRDAWTNDFIVAVQAASDLRDGKVLRAIAVQQFNEHGAAMTGQSAAADWLSRRGVGSQCRPGASERRNR